MSGSGKSDRPRVQIGAHGLPLLDALDDGLATQTRQTETNTRAAPISAKVGLRATLTVVVGVDAGNIVTCRDGATIGRGMGCELMLPDPGVSRQHVRVERDGDDWIVADLESKNGTCLNGKPITRAKLASGDEIQVGAIVTLRFAMMGEVEEKLARQLYDSSMRDALTRVFNRRYFMDRLTTELAFAARHKTVVSVGVFDFDHFKKLNDTFGHAAGDTVLRTGAETIVRVLRAEDVLARIGGEEFAFILRGIQPADALACAERVRRAVESMVVMVEGQPVPATISIGVATDDECEAHARTPEGLLTIADRRLYEAKTAGRNRAIGR